MELWVALSLLAAFGQAFGWALKKKALEDKGVNHTLATVSFLVAGGILCLIWGIKSQWVMPQVTEGFIIAASGVIIANIIAVWAAYRALDRADLSLLMPFVAVTALTIVPIEYLVRGIVPNSLQVIGMGIVVVGAISFASKMPDRQSLSALRYFMITVLCYSVASPLMGVAVDESGNALFSAMVFHLGIGLGFMPFVLLAKESRALRMLSQKGQLVRTVSFMVGAGFIVALLENGPATVALADASASEVFALKRTMPIFALILGVVMFREAVTVRKVAATALLIIGSGVVVYFQ